MNMIFETERLFARKLTKEPMQNFAGSRGNVRL